LFHPKERVLAVVMGASGFLGRGYWRIEDITLTDPALNPCQISERNHLKLLRWFMCSFVVGYKKSRAKLILCGP
jgi:hypothetical protein